MMNDILPYILCVCVGTLFGSVCAYIQAVEDKKGTSWIYLIIFIFLMFINMIMMFEAVKFIAHNFGGKHKNLALLALATFVLPVVLIRYFRDRKKSN
jgi:EamA domain-containing membrane protein RarD